MLSLEEPKSKPFPQLPQLELKTSLSLDPDKGLDLELIKYYKCFKPNYTYNY
jgi:hypothetical protein